MISAENSSLIVVVKNVLHKTFAVIGMGTVVYYAYFQISGGAISPNSTDESKSIVHRSTVPVTGENPFRRDNGFRFSNAPHPFNPVLPAPLAPPVAAPTDPNALPNGLVIAPPGSVPVVPDKEKKPEDMTEEEKAAKAEQDAAAAAAANGNAQPVPFYPFGAPYPQQPQPDPNQQQPTPPLSDSKPVDPNAAAGQDLGPSITPPSTTTGSTTYGGGSNVASAQTAQSNLTSADLIFLAAHPFNATFDMSTEAVNGHSCLNGNCTPMNNMTIPRNRWSKDHGIKSSQTSLVYQTGSSTSAVKFNLGFVIQDQSNGEVPVSVTLTSTDASMTHETISGQSYKVFQFTFASASAQGASIGPVRLTLAYQMQGTQATLASPNASLAPELTFSRSGVETVTEVWPTPSTSSEATLKPDHVDYIIHLQ